MHCCSINDVCDNCFDRAEDMRRRKIESRASVCPVCGDSPCLAPFGGIWIMECDRGHNPRILGGAGRTMGDAAEEWERSVKEGQYDET